MFNTRGNQMSEAAFRRMGQVERCPVCGTPFVEGAADCENCAREEREEQEAEDETL